jgi:acyl-CoA synthetase (AMP-forming)/AMP-acid ligase II
MTRADSMKTPYLGIDTRPHGVAGQGGRELLQVTFPQLFARQARAFADREFLVDGRTRLTYAEFESRMTDVARSLMVLGVTPGDRVAIWAPNCAEWLMSALGASATGAAIMPINSRSKGAEAIDVVTRGRPRVLFTTRRFLNTDYPAILREAGGAKELGVRIVVLDGDAADGDLSFEEFLALGVSVSVDAAIQRRESISPRSVSDIMLTSGTTGRPKGVMTSHHQNVLAWLRYAKHLNLQAGERINATLPFFHNFGFKAGFLVSTLLGGTCICDTTFDATRLARVIETERISFLKGTPTLFTSLLASPARNEADLGSLRLCLVAGAMVSRELVEQMQAELCEQIITGYGLSELAGGIALTPEGADTQRVAGWSGQVVEGVEVMAVDGKGVRVPPDQPGEILARGECVMLGYMDDPGAAAAAVDSDGWLRTGDIGIVDEENYVRITDRKKDMFIVGGFNAYPAEIERLLLEHPGLAQVAIVGIPDDRLGEVGAACVVAKPGVELEPEEIIRWARKHMANYKVPRRVEVVDQLPVNASLKVLKHELRARLARRPASTAGA